MACKIGVIGDGPTDLKVIGKFAECVATFGSNPASSLQIIELRRQNIRDAVDKYWRDASSSNDYSITGEAGRKLLGMAFAMLQGAVNEFESQVGGGNVSWRDFIVLSTDAERYFETPEAYFETWAIHLPKILLAATEKTYQQLVNWGYDPLYIPMIVPLALYPSTEVVVAAAKKSVSPIHGRRAKELKLLLYNVHDLKLLSSEDFARSALDHLTTDAIEPIFRQIPECRPFIHSLLRRGLSLSGRMNN